MPGTEFVRRARQSQPCLPVVYVTGNADPLRADQGDRRDAVLTKPYRLNALRAAIRDVLAARRPGDRP
jgi:CheY-like chemotaxis protein